MSRCRFSEDVSGSVTYVNLVLLIAFIAIGGLAIDGSNAFRMRAMMQATADAAALAAAVDLPDAVAARATAMRFVEANMPAGGFDEITGSAEITVGAWDAETREVVAGTGTNAIKVVLARSEERDNALPTFLTRIIGHTQWSLTTSAVAIGRNTNCAGVLSNGRVKMKQRPRIGSKVCVYGKDGIKIGHDLVAEAGARIGMEDLDDFKLGKDSAVPDGVLFEAEFTASRAAIIDSIIADWVGPAGNGVGGKPPNGWSVVGPLEDLPDELSPMTIYYIDGNLKISQDYKVRDVILAVDGDVRWGHDGRFSNTQSCENGEAIGLYVTGDIRMGHDPVGRGIDMVAGGGVHIGHDIGSSEMMIEAAGDIDFGHDPDYTNTCRPIFGVNAGASLRQ